MLRRFYQDISESTTYTLLCGTQPEFLSSSEWDGLRKTAISVFEDDFNREVNAAVNSSDALLLLELRQPVQLAAETWTRLTSHAEERFFALLRERI